MIEKILIVALFSYGYCATFWEGHIFEKIGNWAESNLPEKLWKPLGGCAICSSFWIGTLMYWIFWGDYWVHWIIISVCAVGLCAVIVNLINKVEAISEAFKPDDK